LALLSNRISLPQPMHPHGPMGRLFGRLMEWGNQNAYERALTLMEPRHNGTFLEIGFGTGRLLEMVAQRQSGGVLAGIDPSSLMLERARRRLTNKGFMSDLKLGLADSLPWGEAQFDAVAALHCFQFWPDPAKTIDEINRVLKKEGRLVLILRNHEQAKNIDWLPNPLSRHRQEAAEAVKLLQKAGLGEIVRLPNVGTSPVITARKPA